MNRKMVIVALVAAMALTLSGLVWADQGCDDCDGQCVEYPKRAHMPMLTAEQREEVKARAAELNEQGASPEEVRAVIAEMLKEWGIQPMVGQSGQQAGPRWGQQAAPPRWGQRAQTPRWGQRGMGMMQQGQRRMGMMQPGQRGMGMMQQGLGMMQRGLGMMQRGMGMMQPGQRGMDMMQQWGQQGPPPQWGQQGPPPQWGQPAPPPYWGQQQQAWRGQPGRYGQQVQPPRWQMILQRLTADQREQVKTKITELREDGASGQEIREAVGDMLEGWDIQLPQRPAQNP